MLEKLKKTIKTSPLLRRILWTIAIVFVYMLGKYTPIATLPTYRDLKTTGIWGDSLDNLAMITGGQFSSLNLFSLGLSPWMTTMILWRFFTLFKKVQGMTNRQTHYYRMLMMLVISLIQAFGFSAMTDYFYLESFGDASLPILRTITIFILVAGSFGLMWLADQNGRLGLGGPTAIIISNMILSFLVNATRFFQENRFDLLMLLGFLVLFVLITSLLVWITVRVYRAEYRIPIRRINVISRLVDSTYLPIRLTPAGGMPFMYAMTLMSLPPMIVIGLLQLFPNSELLLSLRQQMSISQLPGIIVYISMLFILAIGFAYFNVDPAELSNQMRKSGDYIVNVRPGKETQDYIEFYLWRLALIGAIYTSVMGGLPLLFVWSQKGELGLALLVNNIYIVTSLLLGMVEQVRIIRSWKSYRDII